MKNSKFVIDKLAKLFEQGLVSSKDLANELMNILKSKRDEIVFRMRLTSKDEFEILKKRVENLEKKTSQFKSLKKNNKWEEIEFFKSDYIASKDVNAWLGIYKVKK